jgi:hypothetical protein
MNLADTHVRVSLWTSNGFARTPEPDAFNDPVDLSVARVTEVGFESVDYTLGTTENLVPGARLLQIVDPVPGEYVVASAEHTCEADPAPFAEGLIVGTFELTEQVPPPTNAGTATWLGQTIGPDTQYLGMDADCSDVWSDQPIVRSRFRLDFSEEAFPWAQALDLALEIDGVTVGAHPPEFIEPGAIVRQYVTTCDDTNRISDGPHTLRFVGLIEGTPVASSSVDFTFDCPSTAAASSVNEDPAVNSTEPIAPAVSTPQSPSETQTASTPQSSSSSGCAIRQVDSRGLPSPFGFLILAALGALVAYRRTMCRVQCLRPKAPPPR